jgi:hypothetical protein
MKEQKAEWKKQSREDPPSIETRTDQQLKTS